MWHTFATHGICPGCSKMWHDTQCPRCKLWSPIDDWYREDVPERQPAVRRRQPETQEELSTALRDGDTIEKIKEQREEFIHVR